MGAHDHVYTLLVNKLYELCNILCLPMPSRKSLRMIRITHFTSNPVICRKSTLNISSFCCRVTFFPEMPSRNALIRAIVNPVPVRGNFFSNTQRTRSAKSFPLNSPVVHSLKYNCCIFEKIFPVFSSRLVKYFTRAALTYIIFLYKTSIHKHTVRCLINCLQLRGTNR